MIQFNALPAEYASANEKILWQEIFKQVKEQGKFTSPRGLKILEVENCHYELPPYIRFCNFEPRNLKLDYIKAETLWYLRGDPYDLSILKYSNIWKNIVLRGRLNSNYGLYFFRKGGLNWVVSQLGMDKDSRRACITLLDESHLEPDQLDVPCTSYINFRIRENALNMSVHMRSQDAIYGMANDAPAFSFLHEMVYCYLLRKYPDLTLGTYHHTSDSFHVYERHFEMLEKILDTNVGFQSIDCPRISGWEEVDYLLTDITAHDRKEPPEEFKFSRWLIS